MTPDPKTTTPSLPEGVTLRHASSVADLTACFPVISILRPKLAGSESWLEEASRMAPDGYRVLAAWRGKRVLAVAGYRAMRNLIHGRFLYVDDLVTAQETRGQGLGAALLSEVSAIAAPTAAAVWFSIRRRPTRPRDGSMRARG